MGSIIEKYERQRRGEKIDASNNFSSTTSYEPGGIIEKYERQRQGRYTPESLRFLNKDARKYLNTQYKKTWEYDLYDQEDVRRQKLGYMPKALEAKYGDSEEERFLAKEGLPMLKNIEQEYGNYADYADTYNLSLEFENEYFKGLAEAGTDVDDNTAAEIYYGIMAKPKYKPLAGYVSKPKSETEYADTPEGYHKQYTDSQKEVDPYAINLNYRDPLDIYRSEIEKADKERVKAIEDAGYTVEQVDAAIAADEEIKRKQMAGENEWDAIAYDTELTDAEKRVKLGKYDLMPQEVNQLLSEYHILREKTMLPMSMADAEGEIELPKLEEFDLIKDIQQFKIFDEAASLIDELQHKKTLTSEDAKRVRKMQDEITKAGMATGVFSKLKLTDEQGKQLWSIIYQYENALRQIPQKDLRGTIREVGQWLGTSLAGGISSIASTAGENVVEALNTPITYLSSPFHTQMQRKSGLNPQEYTKAVVAPITDFTKKKYENQTEYANALISGELSFLESIPETYKQLPDMLMDTHKQAELKLLHGLNETEKFFATTGLSIADNILTIVLFSQAAPAVMGIKAAGHAAYDVKERGGTAQQQLLQGILAGGAEFLGESFAFKGLNKILAGSLPVLKGNISGWFTAAAKKFGAQVGREVIEEGATEAMNILSDMAVMQDKSEMAQYYYDYLAKNPGDPKATAVLAAVFEGLRQTLLAAGAGGISGGVLGGGAMIGSNINIAKQGKQLRPYVGELIEAGLELNPESTAYKNAVKLQGMNKISDTDIGKQYYANIEAQAAELRSDFETDLQELGLDEKNTALAMKVYDRLSSGKTKNTKALTKIKAAITQATAQKADAQADFKAVQTEIMARIQPFYQAMQKAANARNIQAFNQAKEVYDREVSIAKTKVEAARQKAQNKATVAEKTVKNALFEAQDGINQQINDDILKQTEKGAAPNGNQTARDAGIYRENANDGGRQSISGQEGDMGTRSQGRGTQEDASRGGGHSPGIYGTSQSNEAESGIASTDAGGSAAATSRGLDGSSKTGRVVRGLTKTPEAITAIESYSNDVYEKTGIRPNIQIVNEVSKELASKLDGVKTQTGMDVFLYQIDVENGDNGFTDRKNIFLNINPSTPIEFNYGHEYAHVDGRIKKAGQAVIDRMDPVMLKRYEEYRNSNIHTPDNADVRSELIADMFGKYMFEIQKGEELSNTFGVNQGTIDQFQFAFQTALTVQENADGEAVYDVLFQSEGKLEMSRVALVEFPKQRFANEQVSAITIDEDIGESESISDIRKDAKNFIKETGLRNKVIIVNDLNMPVKLNYQNGLKKVIQKIGPVEHLKKLLKILPKYEHILESSKYYMSSESTKEKNAGVEFTHLVNLVSMDGGYYAVATTLQLRPFDSIDQMHGYEIESIDVKKIKDYPLSANADSEHLSIGSWGNPSISIRNLVESVKHGDYLKITKMPKWVDTTIERSRISFTDPQGYRDKQGNILEYSYNMPKINEFKSQRYIDKNGGRFYADITVDGKRNRFVGDTRESVETKIKAFQEDRRMQRLSRPVQVQRKAGQIYDTGINLDEYFKNALTDENYDHEVGKALIGIALRNGENVGGMLNEKQLQDILNDSDNWKDKSAISYGREILDRNLEDIASSKQEGRKLVETFALPVHKHVADMVRWQRIWEKRIRELKLNAEDSAMVQLLGEGKVGWDVIENGLLYENGTLMDVEKIQNAADAFNEFYEEALTMSNATLIKNGYKPILKRKNYFPHIDEVGNDWQNFIKNVIRGDEMKLPTPIAGMTDIFKPGKRWFRNFQQRLGDETAYDAVRGFEQYLSGVGHVIFLTDDIQRLRQFEQAIREKHDIDGTSELKGKTKAQHLSGLVAQLREYTNQLAGKQAKVDRVIEEAIGRKWLARLNWLKKRFAANAVGMNIATALTNHIPLTQALATMKKSNFALGMKAALSRQVRNDGLWERSNFLMSRFGTLDPIPTRSYDVRNPLALSGTKQVEAIKGKVNWMFETVDRYVAETIVFGKYNEGLQQGLTSQEAMQQADEYARRIMAGRTIGSVPTLFNTKTFGLLTQFQLEINNQMSNMMKDVPHWAGGDKKKIVAALIQLFIYSWLYNELNERFLSGRRPAFDPINVVVEAVEDFSSDPAGDALFALGENVLDQLPLGQILTDGGRIPLASALESISPWSAIKKTLNGDEGAAAAWGKLGEGVLYNFALPFGGAQAKKTGKGINTLKKEGYYSASGKLNYPVENDFIKSVRTMLFGSSSTAPTGFDWQRDPLSNAKTAEYEELKAEDIPGAYGFLQYLREMEREAGSSTKAGELTAIVSFDADGDGKPDYDEETQRKIAEILNINITAERLAKQAEEAANQYIKNKRNDDDLEKEKLEDAERMYKQCIEMLEGR